MYLKPALVNYKLNSPIRKERNGTNGNSDRKSSTRRKSKLGQSSVLFTNYLWKVRIETILLFLKYAKQSLKVDFAHF
jgi:hypothetical protein